MAELRLIAAAMLVAAGCRASEADPGSGLAPPEGWQPLPALAKAASAAAAESGITALGSEAWGETARGCYAAWIALRGGTGTPDRMADELVRSLSAEPALEGIVVRDVVKPIAGAEAGVLSLGFEHGGYRGKLRATLGKGGAVAALACFWNEREPIACEQGCTMMIGSMQ